MNNFKVGDKVVRLPRADNSLFAHVQGDKDYYVVTSISNGRNFVQLDGVAYRADTHPWDYKNFELYQEPEDEGLPPVPGSVMYFNSVRDGGNNQHLVVEMTDMSDMWTEGADAHIGLRVVPKTGSTRASQSIGINLDPEAALQLASDLRRMAMEIKRKEKAQ